MERKPSTELSLLSGLILMSTLAWIIEKELEREIKTKETNLDERKTSENETEC